ncbi:hypothetical protein [Afifella sp. IM 167]|uniref:hypothetical protein n=1 Tax=Afifella sp. IM 167 TaxID=2033586 RepID=UPI001CCA91E7|nr:hypothetical protein [Afifella sp. IM 167]MBZ8132758.1 hypothetical protein [Afifella sp. IM 167]
MQADEKIKKQVAALLPERRRRADLSGRWQVVHRVTHSALGRYVGLEMQFDIRLRQEGARLSGEGVKYRVGEELIAREEASVLEIEGRLEGEHVRLNIVERSPANPERCMRGAIDWEIVRPELLAGTFQVEAADSSGGSRAVRTSL